MSDSLAPFALTIELDRNSPVPLYDQIAKPLEELIQSGELAPGRLIEDEVSMANRLQVSRPTARRALQDLVSRGLLTRRRGIGTRVTPTHVRRPLSLTSLQDDLTKAGFKPSTEVLHYEVRLANAGDAKHLGCQVGDEIVSIVRLRRIDQRPLAILTNLMPASIAPSITQLTSGGLYAAFASLGIHPSSAQQSIGARFSEPEEAEHLGIEHPSPVLTMRRTAYDASGQIVEYGNHVYNPEHYSFHLTLTSE
ncbi:GntR family transcriptional regulator [Schaalia canis]|uniref:GntR family transcriptional regulator n=2 Tax=Schaalia canis TaxID=100469 RepID=A0A3P1SI71_9ACTO|nr:GntR family transcriptional regulator [Schaalia canis]RRC96022.1 GntR family transcriptional regulator [Schaalia canis]